MAKTEHSATVIDFKRAVRAIKRKQTQQRQVAASAPGRLTLAQRNRRDEVRLKARAAL